MCNYVPIGSGLRLAVSFITTPILCAAHHLIQLPSKLYYNVCGLGMQSCFSHFIKISTAFVSQQWICDMSYFT